jgi:hypothetical protein
MILAAAAMAALVGAASAASATTFSGNYSATGYWTSESNGLQIIIDDFSGDNDSGGFNVTGLDFGESQSFDLFWIAAGESVNNPSGGSDGDTTSRPINVNFTFSAPTNFPGSGPDTTITGQTVAIQGGQDDYGRVTWNGSQTVDFGANGRLTISLATTDFDTAGYYYSGYNNVRATFALAAPLAGGAVPEPATWGMMIMGFGLAGATMRRRRSAAVAA